MASSLLFFILFVIVPIWAVASAIIRRIDRWSTEYDDDLIEELADLSGDLRVRISAIEDALAPSLASERSER